MKSMLIIGLGRFGRHMALKCIEEGSEVLCIEKDEEVADANASKIRNIQIGDARNEEYLESLGVSNFDLCVVAIGDSFQSALEITVLLKDLGAKYILARATRDVHRKLLLRNGADYVVYAERDIAERLAVRFSANNIFDFIELTPEYGIYEVVLPHSWIGKTILDLDVRNRYGISILATKENGVLSPQPFASHVFTNHESILILGTHDRVRKFTQLK